MRKSTVEHRARTEQAWWHTEVFFRISDIRHAPDSRAPFYPVNRTEARPVAIGKQGVFERFMLLFTPIGQVSRFWPTEHRSGAVKHMFNAWSSLLVVKRYRTLPHAVFVDGNAYST